MAGLAGTDKREIVEEAERVLADESAYAAMAQAGNPHGDGGASERIAGLRARRQVVPFGKRAEPGAHSENR